MFKGVKNSKKQGDIGVAAAIGWFVMNQYTVSVPLGESQDYNLVVDGGDGLKRVQVKTTSYKTPSGMFNVGLRVLGGNRSWNGVAKEFDKSKVELLFVLTSDGDQYLIPSGEIANKNALALGTKYEKFKITGGQSLAR